jgi:hypothetical protein
MAALAPDRRAITSHLNWLAEPALETDPTPRLELAWGEPDQGPSCARTYRLDQLDDAADFAAWVNRTGANVYVGSTLKKADTPFKGRTGASHAALAVCLPVDVDGAFHDGLQKLESIAKPQLLVTTGTIPELRGQLWLRTTPTADLAQWEEVNRRSVHFCGGDRNALGTYRLMRLAGTVSYPSPQKEKRGYVIELTTITFCDAPTYDLSDLLNSLPPVAKATPVGAKTSTGPKHLARRIPLNRVNVAIVKTMLDALPEEYAEDYDLWLCIGFALHSFDPGDVGLKLWINFSERCPDKAADTDFETQWGRLDRPYDGDKITLGTLWHHARRHGWRMPCPWDFFTTIQHEAAE